VLRHLSAPFAWSALHIPPTLPCHRALTAAAHSLMASGTATAELVLRKAAEDGSLDPYVPIRKLALHSADQHLQRRLARGSAVHTRSLG